MSNQSPESAPNQSIVAFHVNKPIRLRGHHLLCMLTYIGEGYTLDFIDNFDALAAHFNKVIKSNRRVSVEIIGGLDDICAALHINGKVTCDHASDCVSDSVKHRDAVALREIARALQMPSLKTGDILEVGEGEIRHLRLAFVNNTIRAACILCSWNGICSRVAAGYYNKVKLLPRAQP